MIEKKKKYCLAKIFFGVFRQVVAKMRFQREIFNYR